MWGDGGWMWLWGSLMMIFWVGVIAVIVWLVIRAGHGGVGGTRSARRILDERYARGEIETDDYEARVEKLR
jgi:putative membrane protein